MPVFEIEDSRGRIIQMDGDHEPSQVEIEQAFADAFPSEASATHPSARPAMPEPGQSGPVLASRGVDAITQAAPINKVEQAAGLPGIDIEQVATTPFTTLPRVGEPGTVTRGLSELGAGLVEQALLTPASGALAVATTVPGLRLATGTLLTAAATKGAAEKLGEGSVTGNRQTITEGVGLGLMAGLAATGVAADAIARNRAIAPASTAAAEAATQLVPKSSRLMASRNRMPDRESSAPELGNILTAEQAEAAPAAVESSVPRRAAKSAEESPGWDIDGEIRRNPDGYFERIENGEVMNTDGSYESLLASWGEANAGYSQRVVQTKPDTFKLFLKDPGEMEAVHELVPLRGSTPNTTAVAISNAEAVPEALGPATPGAPLPTSTPSPLALPPKSQRLIIKDLAKGFDLPVRFGRLENPRAGGYFKRIQNLIGSKKANDIPVVSHEVGHKLDDLFSFSSEAKILPELDVLGDPATTGSMSSWTKSKTGKYKMGEGVAEFVRYWLTDPAQAQKMAPNTFAHFESVLGVNKDFADVMRTAQKDIEVWRNAQPQARLRSHISIGENPNRTPYSISQLTRDLVDDLHYAKLATDTVKKSEPNLPPSKDIYLQARLLRGTYGMADTFVRKGVADFKTKAVTLGTSLEDALKPVSGKMDDFRDWIVAKRAQELMGRGKETGLVPSDVSFVAKKFDGDPAFQAAFKQVKDWQDSLLKYAEDAGLITAESRQAIQDMNHDYVPFHRVFEVGAGEKPAAQTSGTGRGLNVGKPGSLKTLKGSPRDIVDPLESMVRNAYSLITASEKAHINKSLAELADKADMGRWVEKIATPKEHIKVGVAKIRDQLEAAGADLTKVPDDLLLSFFQNSKTAPFGENIIRVVRDGKPEFYRLDSELFKTFHALDLEEAGTLVSLISKPAQWLRSGVVLAPDFTLANALRDTFSAAVLSKYGTFPFQVTMKGVSALIGNPKLVAEWAAAGGKNSIEAAYFDRAKTQAFLRERISKDLSPAERATVVVKSPLTALRWLTEKAEEATRIGEYKTAYDQLIKSGVPEGDARRMAAFEARDRQDFSKGGAITKELRRMAPFWNAALQANIKLASTFKHHPIRTTLKGLAFVTIPKLMEQAVNYDDPDYWDRPQWERDLFFLIPFAKDDNGHTRFLRIPTPFEVGVIFGTLPGRLIQFAKTRDDEAVKSYFSRLLYESTPKPMPTWAGWIFENFMAGKQGWDIFRGRPIVPDSLKDAPPELQFTEQTSLAARKLGELLGVSPLKIEQLVNSTTGGLGRQLTHNVADPIISAVTGEQRTAQGKAPGGRFVTTPAGVSSHAVETFYKHREKITAEEFRLRKTGSAAEFVSLVKAFDLASEKIAALRRVARMTKDTTERQKILLQISEVARQMNQAAETHGL